MCGAFNLGGFKDAQFSLEAVLVLQMAAEKFVCDYLAMAYIPIERCGFNGNVTYIVTVGTGKQLVAIYNVSFGRQILN